MITLFTVSQIEKIQEFISKIHDLINKENKNFTIENLQMFKDEQNNFYASYFFSGEIDGGMQSDTKYFKIDREGVKTNLKSVYSSESVLRNKFSTLEKIKL